jgi:protein arginine kinase activator
MKCCQSDCENEATVHLTEIVNGQMKKIDLCEECAKEKGVTDPQGFALADLLLGLGASSEMDSAGPELECPTCGFAQADFKKTGRLGCSTCYTVFAEPLEGMLKQMHKGTQHIGKVPKALRAKLDTTKQRERLNTQLKKAIETENYEEAAQLRDQLKELEVVPASEEEA